jgi:hypothetical protein
MEKITQEETKRQKMYEPGDFVDAPEYCTELNTILKKYNENEKDIENFPWDTANNSDHRPIKFHWKLKNTGNKELDEKGLKFVTFNCLNPKYSRWLHYNDDNSNQRLSTHRIASTDFDITYERMQKIAEWVLKCLVENYFICLQEVSWAQYEIIYRHLKLKELDSKSYVMFTTRCKFVSDKFVNEDTKRVFNNCNLTIFTSSVYNTNASYHEVEKNTLIPENEKEHEGPWESVLIRVGTSNADSSDFRFNLVNAHLSYNQYLVCMTNIMKNEKLARYPTIVCGDLNVGVRLTDQQLMTHDQHISNFTWDRMKFPRNYTDMNDALSHVAYYANVGSDCRYMAERYDHIILIEPDNSVKDKN